MEQLQEQAKHVHLPKIVLAERYVQEGLAVDQFPGMCSGAALWDAGPASAADTMCGRQ